MAAIRFLIVIMRLACGAFVVAPANASLTLSADGQTVYDSQGVTWLANANSAATLTFGLPYCSGLNNFTDCVNHSSGSMNYASAQLWVTLMNRYNKIGYLGHNNWQLPATQTMTAGCTSTGTNSASFAYNCTGSAMGSLYYNGLGLAAPSSNVAPTQDKVPTQGQLDFFTDLQPNLYWTATAAGGGDGFHTFSFANGWRGSNQGANPSDLSKGPKANFF